MPLHLGQPYYVALGRALIWGLYPDEIKGSFTIYYYVFKQQYVFHIALSFFKDLDRDSNSDQPNTKRPLYLWANSPLTILRFISEFIFRT